MDIGTKICICSACVPKSDELRCSTAQSIPHAFKTQYCEGMAAVYEYRGPVRKAMTEFKFQDKPSYFRTFSAEMAQLLHTPGNSDFVGSTDFICAVPMHPKKERARGYNQARLLSREIARLTGLPEHSDVLQKPSSTRTQHLGANIARFSKMPDTYITQSNAVVRGASVLIIDDVITTGCTINECARALKLAGAAKVYGLAFATNKKELIIEKSAF